MCHLKDRPGSGARARCQHRLPPHRNTQATPHTTQTITTGPRFLCKIRFGGPFPERGPVSVANEENPWTRGQLFRNPGPAGLRPAGRLMSTPYERQEKDIRQHRSGLIFPQGLPLTLISSCPSLVPRYLLRKKVWFYPRISMTFRPVTRSTSSRTARALQKRLRTPSRAPSSAANFCSAIASRSSRV